MSCSHSDEAQRTPGPRRHRRSRWRCQRSLLCLLGAGLLLHLASSVTALWGRAAFERTVQAWHGDAPWSHGLRWGLVYIPLLAYLGHRLLGAPPRPRQPPGTRRVPRFELRLGLGVAALGYLLWHTGHFVGFPPGGAPILGSYDRWAAELSSTTSWGFPAAAVAHLVGVACSVAYFALALGARQRKSTRKWWIAACLLGLTAGWTTVLHFATGWPTW